VPGQEQLVFFVEGQGDCAAIPSLAKRMLKESFGPDCPLRVDLRPFTVGNLAKLTGRCAEKWVQLLGAALKSRQPLGGVVLLLDGDAKCMPPPAPPKTLFCPATAARVLAAEARKAGAGDVFSVAVVFACPEFETWLIAGREGFAGQLKPDIEPPVDVEKVRDAKRWLKAARRDGYQPTIHQLELAKAADLIAMRSLRSFRRFENALNLLVEAHAKNDRVVTPE
jgi:hypothetical protein